MIKNLLKSSILMIALMLNSINCQAMDSQYNLNDTNTDMQLAMQGLGNLIDLQQTFQNNSLDKYSDEIVLKVNRSFNDIIRTIRNMINNNNNEYFPRYTDIEHSFKAWVYERLFNSLNEVCQNESKIKLYSNSVKTINDAIQICTKIEQNLIDARN